MLNHARTLLMNVDAASQDYSVAGEELIAPEFHPRALASELQMVRRYLFGANPDRLMMNYRCYQLMSLLHSVPELEAFVLSLDHRITYWPLRDNNVLFSGTFGQTVQQTAGQQPVQLWFLGEATAAAQENGQLTYQWDIEIIDSNTVAIQMQKPRLSSWVQYDYTITQDLSSPVQLPGVKLLIQFPTAPDGTRWLVTSLVRPGRDLGQISADLSEAGSDLFLSLFGVLPKEPYLTFRNLWTGNRELVYKLGGLLLALIYRSHQSPTAYIPPVIPHTPAAAPSSSLSSSSQSSSSSSSL